MSTMQNVIQNLTARPIRFTADIPAWQHIIETLGGTLISEHPGWLVYQLGSGRLALHASHPDQPAGSTSLPLETSTPLPEAVELATAEGAPITLTEQDHGTAGLVTAPDGTSFTLDSPTPASGSAAASEPRLRTMSIWYTDRTADARTILTALGGHRQLTADDGVWTTFICPGGGTVAVHASDEVGAELAFEWDGDVEDAKALLDAAGVETMLIDETYGRTLQITDPDGGEAVWVNEKQTDLYGYTLSEL